MYLLVLCLLVGSAWGRSLSVSDLALADLNEILQDMITESVFIRNSRDSSQDNSASNHTVASNQTEASDQTSNQATNATSASNQTSTSNQTSASNQTMPSNQTAPSNGTSQIASRDLAGLFEILQVLSEESASNRESRDSNDENAQRLLEIMCDGEMIQNIKRTAGSDLTQDTGTTVR